MNLFNNLRRLAKVKEIYIHGQADIRTNIEQYISMNINPKAHFGVEGGLPVFYLDSLNSFEAYMRDEGDSISVLNMAIISSVHQLFPRLYLAFEERMKEVLKKKILPKVISNYYMRQYLKRSF